MDSRDGKVHVNIVIKSLFLAGFMRNTAVKVIECLRVLKEGESETQ